MQEFLAVIGAVLAFVLILFMGFVMGANQLENEFQKKMDAGYVRIKDEKVGYIWTKKP